MSLESPQEEINRIITMNRTNGFCFNYSNDSNYTNYSN